MEGGEVSAIWAALQAADGGASGGGGATAAASARSSYAVAGFTDDAGDDDDDDDEEDDDEEDDDEVAPVMPQRVGGGLLPPSFYSATSTGLPDVVPAFLLPAQRPYAAAPSAVASSSEMFLDDILHAQDEPFGGGGSTARLTPERLSQLEDNYERKKKRAKINRRDLNSRFQELMDLLRLKEDRKLNRAKVLEKAIEQLHKLQDELAAAKLQLQRHATTTNNVTPTPFPNGALPLSMPLPLPQWTPGVNVNMAAQMMWMPMLPPPPPQPVSRPSSARAARSKTARASAASATHSPVRTTVSMQTQTSPERPTSSTAMAVRRPGLKRTRDGASASSAVALSASSVSLVWIAQEVPALLELCDAWTLRDLQGVSRELRAAARRDALWQTLCARRWRLDPSSSSSSWASPGNALSLWTQMDAANEMPRCECVTGATVAFASGRRNGVAVWASLVRRSNGRTTRTVLVEGKAVVRQVVELNVVVQNLDPCTPLRVTDELRVRGSGSSSHFELFTSDSGAHLAPHLVAVNGVPHGSSSVAGVELFHGDFCVLSVFVACDGLDLEQQFLDRVDGIEIQCEQRTRNGPMQPVCVAARACLDKQTRIADMYGVASDKSV